MPTPALWAGMGRAMNNVSAALLTNASVALLVSDSNGMASIILALVLFVAVSVVIYLYTAWMPVSSGTPKDIPTDLGWSIQRKVFRRSQMDCIYPGEPVSGISRRSMRKQV